jgi:hypothetical protein
MTYPNVALTLTTTLSLHLSSAEKTQERAILPQLLRRLPREATVLVNFFIVSRYHCLLTFSIDLIATRKD